MPLFSSDPITHIRFHQAELWRSLPLTIAEHQDGEEEDVVVVAPIVSAVPPSITG